jgi:type IV secretion system protein VirB1
MILSAALVAHLAAACAPEAATGTLAAVAAAESGLDPLAIYDNTAAEAWRPRSRPEAVALARYLIGAGHTVDLGLMQIDSRNLARLRLAVAEAFDPCASLAAGARVLADAYRGGTTHSAQQAALRVAFSRYNTGSPTSGFRNGYVARVLAAARRVVPEIDVEAAAPESPERAGAPATSWEIFGGAVKGTQPDASSWNVFPQSVGPDRLADPPAAAPADGSLSPPGMSVGGTHD